MRRFQQARPTCVAWKRIRPPRATKASDARLMICAYRLRPLKQFLCQQCRRRPSCALSRAESVADYYLTKVQHGVIQGRG